MRHLLGSRELAFLLIGASTFRDTSEQFRTVYLHTATLEAVDLCAFEKDAGFPGPLSSAVQAPGWAVWWALCVRRLGRGCTPVQAWLPSAFSQMTFLQRQLLGCKPHPGKPEGRGLGQGEAISDPTHCTGLRSTTDCHGAARIPGACFLLIPPHQSPNPMTTDILHCALYYFSVCLVVGMLVPMRSFSAHAQFCSGFCPPTWQATCIRESQPR